MAEHTPGPWRENEHGNLVCYPEGLEVGILSPQLPKDEQEANKRVIIAAPELLATLRSGNFTYLGGEYVLCINPDIAKAAIAKAEGKS